jgi:hypothetical protein
VLGRPRKRASGWQRLGRWSEGVASSSAAAGPAPAAAEELATGSKKVLSAATRADGNGAMVARGARHRLGSRQGCYTGTLGDPPQVGAVEELGSCKLTDVFADAMSRLGIRDVETRKCSTAVGEAVYVRLCMHKDAQSAGFRLVLAVSTSCARCFQQQSNTWQQEAFMYSTATSLSFGRPRPDRVSGCHTDLSNLASVLGPHRTALPSMQRLDLYDTLRKQPVDQRGERSRVPLYADRLALALASSCYASIVWVVVR